MRAPVSEHACWAYASDAERAALASTWLADGLKLGQRALYVADLPVDDLIAELADLPDGERALADGALVVLPSSDAYDLSKPIDPAAQLAMYAGVVDQAIADGYEGVRVAADITPLVADEARRPAHVHWEQVADRYIAEHPLAPVCLYDERRITGIDAIVCVHPQNGPDPSPFAVFGRGSSTAAIEGELDALLSEVFSEVLRGLPDTDDVVDVGSLAFIDARSAGVLSTELARRRDLGQRVVITGASPTLRRIWDFCDLDTSLLAPA